MQRGSTVGTAMFVNNLSETLDSVALVQCLTHLTEDQKQPCITDFLKSTVIRKSHVKFRNLKCVWYVFEGACLSPD